MNGMAAEGAVVWAILPGRSTQHAVVVSQETLMAWIECMNRSVPVEELLRRSTPWPQDEAILCKRHWCRNHWYEATSLPDEERARLRDALLKIENELVEHGTLS